MIIFLLLLFVFSSFSNVKSASFYFGGLPESKSALPGLAADGRASVNEMSQFCFENSSS